jgi:hypothetical protein
MPWFWPIGRAEHLALTRVICRALERRPSQSHGLGANQDALGIEPVQDVAEALAFLAGSIGGRDAQAVDEHLVRVDALAPQFVDLAHLDRPAVQVGVEQAQAFGALAFLDRRGAREQQDLVGDLRGADPHLLPVHHVMVALADGARLELERVQAAVGLGHAKARAVLPLDQRRQPAPLLFVAADDHHRMQPEDVHVHCRRAGQAGAGGGDGVHHQRSLADAQAGAAVGLGHGDAEPARLGQRPVEVLRETALTVLAQPVVGVERRAGLLDGVADLLLFRSDVEIHGRFRIDAVERRSSGSRRRAGCRSPAASPGCRW